MRYRWISLVLLLVLVGNGPLSTLTPPVLTPDAVTITPEPTIPPTPETSPTPTGISNPTPTSVAGNAGVLINEYLPAPQAGGAEFVEVYNAGSATVDLRGWFIDDIADGGMAPKKINADLAAGMWLSIEVSGLNNNGDSVRLIDPAGVVMDEHYYTTSNVGLSHSRIPDGGPTWVTGTPATPNAPNTPPAQPTPTPTTIPITGTWQVLVNEYLPAPQTGVSEFIELYNAGPDAADLRDWSVDDAADGGMAPKKITALIPVGGFLVVDVAGLNNDGDSVRLVDASGHVIDSQTYTTSIRGLSHSRIPDGGTTWLYDTPATPAAPNTAPIPVTPVPTTIPISQSWDVLINEYLPAPQTGVSEFIELYNAGPDAADLRDWSIDDVAEGGMAPKIINAVIPAGAWWTIEVSGLNNSGDMVRLMDSDGVVIDSRIYTTTVTGLSHSRIPDGGDVWVEGTPATPSAANLLPPPLPEGLVLNEIFPRPMKGGSEWIELYSLVDHPIDLSGWALDDAAGSAQPYVIPEGTMIAPKGWLVLEVPTMLNDGGDLARLLSPTGQVVDSFAYAKTRRSVSWSRIPDGVGTWFANTLPTPYQPNAFPAAEATLPEGTTADQGALLISEVVYNPSAEPEHTHEWVELFNPSTKSVSLSGWRIRDAKTTTPLPNFDMPPQSVVVVAPLDTPFAANPAFTGTLIVVEESRLGNSLGNTGDFLVLEDSAGMSIDALSWGKNTTIMEPPIAGGGPDSSLQRHTPANDTNAASDWTIGQPPTPGSLLTTTLPLPPNLPATAASPGAILISRVVYDPAEPLRDPSGEWLELTNATTGTVSLHGWTLHDDRSSDALPPIEIPVGATILIAASETVTATFGITHSAYVLKSSIGNGLSNTGDSLDLRDGVGTSIDTVAWGNATTHFSPTVPLVASGAAIQRSGLVDTDGAADWNEQLHPRPLHAGPNEQENPLNDSPILLSELLPAPKYDWNGDQGSDTNDEWIEVVNRSGEPISLQGWQLDDLANGGAKPFVITETLVLAPQTYHVFFRSQTGLSLNNDHDTVRLLDPTGRLADLVEYRGIKADKVLARDPSPDGAWSDRMRPTPGDSNVVELPGEAWGTPQLIATVSATQKTAIISGVVTVAPNVLRKHVLYIEDPSGGILVRLNSKILWPELMPGQQVLLRGKIGTYHGEQQLSVSLQEDVIIGELRPMLPLLNLIGQAPNEAHVGRLVQVSGRYIRAIGRDIELMTSAGALVRLHPPTGMQKPKYRKGAIINAVGIVGIYDGKLRVQLRGLADLGITGGLPVTAIVKPSPVPWMWIIGLVVVGGWLRRRATTHLTN